MSPRIGLLSGSCSSSRSSSNILVTVLDKLVEPASGWCRRRTGKRDRAKMGRGSRDQDAQPGQRRSRRLSGGNQQRVVLAKWMATGPKLLILDSPTVGVDIAAKDGIYEVVKALAAKGVAVLLISDEIPGVSIITRTASS